MSELIIFILYLLGVYLAWLHFHVCETTAVIIDYDDRFLEKKSTRLFISLIWPLFTLIYLVIDLESKLLGWIKLDG